MAATTDVTNPTAQGTAINRALEAVIAAGTKEQARAASDRIAEVLANEPRDDAERRWNLSSIRGILESIYGPDSPHVGAPYREAMRVIGNVVASLSRPAAQALPSGSHVSQADTLVRELGYAGAVKFMREANERRWRGLKYALQSAELKLFSRGEDGAIGRAMRGRHGAGHPASIKGQDKAGSIREAIRQVDRELAALEAGAVHVARLVPAIPEDDPAMEPGYVGELEAARMLGSDPAELRALVARGELRGLWVDRPSDAIMFKRADLDAYKPGGGPAAEDER